MSALGAIPEGGPPEKLRDSLGAETAQWEKLVKGTELKFE